MNRPLDRQIAGLLERIEVLSVLGGVPGAGSTEVAKLARLVGRLEPDGRGEVLARLGAAYRKDWASSLELAVEHLVRNGADPELLMDSAFSDEAQQDLERSWIVNLVDEQVDATDLYYSVVPVEVPQSIGLGVVRAGVDPAVVTEIAYRAGLAAMHCDVFFFSEIARDLGLDEGSLEVSEEADRRVAQVVGVGLSELARYGLD